MSVCQGCGTQLPPKTGRGRDRKWCSEKCRKSSYDVECVDCGTRVDGTTPSRFPADGPRCGACAIAHSKTLAVRQRMSFAHNKRWTDEQIFAAIRSVAKNGVVTTADYDAARERRTRPMPSRLAVINRFDLWSHAVELAGCRTLRRGGRHAHSLTPEGARLAVEDCATALGHVPTYSEYSEWAREVGAPCGTLVRRKTGGWVEAVRVCAAERSQVAA